MRMAPPKAGHFPTEKELTISLVGNDIPSDEFQYRAGYYFKQDKYYSCPSLEIISAETVNLLFQLGDNLIQQDRILLQPG